MNYSVVAKSGAAQNVIEQAYEELMNMIKEFYDLYLAPECIYLHAAVREIEAELGRFSLSIKDIFPGQILHIPQDMLG